MQLAFDNEIYLLDLRNFFHTCDSQTIQRQLATRLFDDDHVTLLGEFLVEGEGKQLTEHLFALAYGFKADAAMLLASYPVFDRALRSGKTLIDLCLVQNEVQMNIDAALMNVNLFLCVQLTQSQSAIFPHAIRIDSTATATKDKGLSEFVRLCFGKPLNKSEQCSNWERRPLRSAQMLYAGQ